MAKCFDVNNATDLSVEEYTQFFIDNNKSVFNSFCYELYNDTSNVSLLAFQELIRTEIKNACYSFVNNNHTSDHIDAYLFASVNKAIRSIKNEDKRNVYVCPGCKYYSKLEILKQTGKKLSCNICQNALVSVKEKWKETFYSTFAEHNRRGFKCPECNNFIPDTDYSLVSCPYPNCIFVGNVLDLKISRHPFIKANLEIPVLNDREPGKWATAGFDNIKSFDAEIVVKNQISEYLQILNNCIDEQMKLIEWRSNNSTIVNKICMYNAFKSMIDKYPEEMISYLVLLNTNVRIQHKIFQEFVRLLEEKIPFSYKKIGKIYEVKSLFDENLCIFDGISEFNAVVNDKHEIPNLIKEIYVGGRKGSYCKPYYIGKLLDVIDIVSYEKLMPFVKEYSFFKIRMDENITPGREVFVRCGRICPHYQMQGMTYLNRIRRAIVDRVYFEINGRKRPISR
jgi:hypothetical protein